MKSLLKAQKPKVVEDLKSLIESYSVVGILDMHKMPTKQVQKMRERLRTIAVFKMARKSLLKKALGDTKPKLAEKLGREPALILSKENPFKLYKILRENRIPSAAKVNDVSPKEIIIPKGPTPIPPGPAIAGLQKIGHKTTVQQGKIAVLQDKVVAKPGEPISADVVNVLNLLKMETMEIGLELVMAFEDGVLYDKSVLAVDAQDYINSIMLGVQQAITLSLNTGYLTQETAAMAVQKAYIEAKALAIEANILEKDFADSILGKAEMQARALQKAAKLP
jgi:large subunit ribosomal protein L10